jgi:hypothetical protein
MTDIKYYFPGITLIALAVIIVAFPDVLVAMIAATIIFAGAVALYTGHMIRKGFDEQTLIYLVQLLIHSSWSSQFLDGGMIDFKMEQ